MKAWSCALVLFLASVLPALADPASVRCGKLFDARTGKMLTDQIVQYDNGRIIKVGPASGASGAGVSGAGGPAAAPIDLSGATCLPGLIDVHTHLTFDPTDSGYASLGVSVPRSTVKGVKNAYLTLQAGFTAVRNVGADGFADVAVRDGVNAGEIEGPRMLVSGPALGITGGHCDNNLLAVDYHYTGEGVADGPWAARTKVREVIKYGADLIKICASGGVLSKGDQAGAAQYTLEEIQAIVDEAHKLGRKVAAHAHGTQSIKDAIRGGVDSVEHSSLIDDEGISLAKQHGTVLVFDIYNDDFILQEGEKVGILPESIEKEKKIGRLQREGFRRAHSGGAKLAFGTDSGVYPHGGNAKQFAKMVEWGMKPAEAIQSATITAAALMGWGDDVGTLEAGHYADLIAVTGDPLADVRVLESVKFVMKGGEVVRDELTRR